MGNTSDIESCIIQNTLEQNEVFTDVIKGYMLRESLMNLTDPVVWSEDFTASWIGRTYTINIPHTIGPDHSDQLFLTLDREFQKNIFIHDPKFFLPKTRPVGIPVGPYIKLRPQNTPNHFYSLPVTEVEELDVSEDPCNLDWDYDYQVCIKGNLNMN